MKTSCAVQMSHLAKEFSDNGHTVTVITPTSDILVNSDFYEHDGYNIFKFRSLKIANIGFIRRAINEFLLPIFFLASYIINPIRKKDFNYIIWYSPSIFFAPITWFLKKKFNSKTYLILRDIFPEWTVDLGLMKKGLIYKFFKFFAAAQYRVADKIGIQSKSNYITIKDYVSKEKVEVLNNWVTDISDSYNTISKIESFKNYKGKKIIYLGNMGVAQDMDSLVGLAEYFQLNHFHGVFLFVGRGTEVNRIKEYVKQKNIKNAFFCDEIHPNDVPSLLKICSVGLLALDPRHNTHNIPGKFISYIQSGLPIIARINPNSDLEELIKNNEIGLVYSDSDLNKFAEKVNAMLENNQALELQSFNSRKLYEAEFTTKSAYLQLIEGYK